MNVTGPGAIQRWRIRWTLDAASDLEQIFQYIRRDNPAAACEVMETITDGVGKLKVFPNLGRNGQVEGTRGMVFPSLPYIAVYRVKEKRRSCASTTPLKIGPKS